MDMTSLTSKENEVTVNVKNEDEQGLPHFPNRGGLTQEEADALIKQFFLKNCFAKTNFTTTGEQWDALNDMETGHFMRGGKIQTKMQTMMRVGVISVFSLPCTSLACCPPTRNCQTAKLPNGSEAKKISCVCNWHAHTHTHTQTRSCCAQTNE
eukprot:scaffold2704_cov159-Amphora_coffeaeformis.AAC.1